MPDDFPSYPKVYGLGHRAIAQLFDGPVTVQEKVDGSQINWRWDADGELHVRSKGSWQYGGPDSRVEPDKLFKPAVDHLLTRDFGGSGEIFRGECVTSPKHNVLAYERAAEGGVVLFDVTDEGWNPTERFTLAEWASVLGIDYLPSGNLNAENLKDIERLVETARPLLGGEHVEGLVFKTFDRFDLDGKPLMGKYVRPEFKETHAKEWKVGNPGSKGIVQLLLDELNTEPRFRKAVQHLAENGELTDSASDIGKLMVEVKTDTIAEEIDYIKDRLWEAFGPQISRGIGRGLPEWYKAELANRQFS